MPDLRSLRRGSLLALSNVYAAAASFILLALVLNHVGLPAFGQLTFMLTAVSIFQVLFNTQSWQGLLRDHRERAPRLLRTCLAIDLGVAAAGAVLLWVSMDALFQHFAGAQRPDARLGALALIVALTPPGSVLAAIRGDGRFQSQAVVDIACSTGKLGLGVAVAHATSPIAQAVSALVVPEALRWLGYLAVSRRALRREINHAETMPTGAELRRIYGFSGWGMLSEISHLPSAYLDKMIVTALLGLEMLAIWDLVKRCIVALVQVTNVVNQMLFPHFVRIRQQLGERALLAVTVRHCVTLGACVAALYIVVLAAFPLWFPRVFHLHDAPLTQVQILHLMIAFAAVMTFVLGAVPVHPLFLSLRHSYETFRLSVAGNLLSLALTWTLVPVLGLYGAVLAILASDGLIISSKFAILGASARRAGSARSQA